MLAGQQIVIVLFSISGHLSKIKTGSPVVLKDQLSLNGRIGNGIFFFHSAAVNFRKVVCPHVMSVKYLENLFFFS